MEGSMLRRHRDQLVRDGENADQALDRMIAETRSTARQRSSPPDSHAVRRLRPVDEQGSRQGNPEGELHGDGLQGARQELGGGRDPGHAGADAHPVGQPQSFGPVATTSASTPGRDSGVAGGGGESSQQATSSLLGPLASPAVVVPGQGLLGGGAGQGGEGSSQVNVFWSPEARKLVGSNQATPVGTAERRSREAEAVEAIRQRLAREMEEAFQREVQQLAASASAVATGGDPNGGGGSAEGEVQSYHTATSAGGLHGGLLGGQQLPLQSIGVPGTMVAYPPGLPADGRGGGGGGESASESLRTLTLQTLPKAGLESSSLAFGDWLVMSNPVMRDLGTSAATWWDYVLRSAQETYGRWLTATPLERLRLRPMLDHALQTRFQRLESRGVTMLLAAMPEELKKEIVASRRLEAAEVMYKPHCLFQPGGSAERTQILKNLVEPKVGSSIGELLGSIRSWRRQVGRAEELGVVLPDGFVLVGVMTRFADTLAKLGGSQLAFRMASARQELALDQRPQISNVKEFSEYLQAEAEELSLTLGATASTSTRSSGNAKDPTSQTIPAVKALAPTAGKSNGGEKDKSRCRFWGTSQGCNRGDDCKFAHSWDGIDKSGRCFGCSAEGHVKRDCPVGSKKTAKVKGKPGNEPPAKVAAAKKGGEPQQQKGVPATSRESTVVIEEVSTSASASSKEVDGSLLSEASGLLKSLGGLKVVRVRSLDWETKMEVDDRGKFALLDGGATHALRQARPDEMKELFPVQVELACGSTTLYQHPRHSTLLSTSPVEPILPLHALASRGYEISWRRSSCTIKHPKLGEVPCVMRNGCPVMDRAKGLALLDYMEKNPEVTYDLSEEDRQWWRNLFPEVPERLLDLVQGQSQSWEEIEGLPLNRRWRKRLWRSKGVLVHLYAGKEKNRWRDLVPNGVEVLSIDIENGPEWNIHHAALWSYLVFLAKAGKIVGIVGGPPCRSTSRLRHRSPGPRPLRGRDGLRWGLDNLTAPEQTKTDGDSMLVLKQLALWQIAEDARVTEKKTLFAMESPEDPMSYMPDQAQNLPSFWNWREVQDMASRHEWASTSFDQGRLGHEKRKPTTMLHNVIPLHEALHGLRGGPESERLPETAEESIQQSRTWSRWADGLVEMQKLTFRPYLESLVKERDDLQREGGSSISESGSDEANLRKISIGKMNAELWRRHIECNHTPFRRDCRICVEAMGADSPHRRRPGSWSAHVMSIDLVGPLKEGKDLGLERTVKYMLLATVPVPYEMDHKSCEVEEKMEEAKDPGELEDKEKDEAGEEEEEDVLEKLRDKEISDPVEKIPDEEAKKINVDWQKAAKEFSVPYAVQNLTIGEPLPSRSVDDILTGLAVIYSKYRAMGVPIIRIHSDREKALLHPRLRSWVARQGVYQTVTAGDDPPSNGRIEGEILQLKRGLRLGLAQTKWAESMWPQVARYHLSVKLKSQLEKLGVPQKPTPPLGSMVMVKRKKWHRESPLSTPFRTMQLLCPSPMMTSGWLVREGDQVVHARVALLPDHQAEVAIRQWEEVENPQAPTRRLRGKQPVLKPEVDLPHGYPVRIVPPGEVPAPLADQEDDYEPESPSQGPALHALQGECHGTAGGEDIRFSSWSSTTSFSNCRQEALCQCVECGTHQMKSLGVCRLCEEPLPSGDESPSIAEVYDLPETAWLNPATAALWEEEATSMEDLVRENEELRKIHWGWRLEMSRTLKQVPDDESEGRLQGCWMKFLQTQLLHAEQDLTEQAEWMDAHAKKVALKLAAVKCNPEEGQDEEPPVVLQTYTVPLTTVRKEIELWKPSFQQELSQLFEETKALRRTTEAELAQEVDRSLWEMAPSKLVPTVKAPLGRRKSRICICGNMLEGDSKKNVDNYAGGADSVTLRAALRWAALKGYHIATVDVKTAFLWAPRRNVERTIVTKPPSIVVAAGLATAQELWVVDGALYGLASSPADWSSHRDVKLAKVRWHLHGHEQWLEQTTEPNVWRIVQKIPGSFDKVETIGNLLTYVDDLMVMSSKEITEAVIKNVNEVWTCSTPDWVSEEGWVKFCGLELRWKGDVLQVGQASYAKELVSRYEGLKERETPLPRLDSEEPVEEGVTLQDVRLAQTIVGELLWLTVRSRPDLAYSVAYLGARTVKSPKHVAKFGMHLLGYIKNTVNWCLEYGPAGENGMEVEVESDASFAPRGERSHQGLLAFWSGGLIQWDSRRQPFATLSTSESELLGYVDGTVMGEGIVTVILALTGDEAKSDSIRHLLGDNLGGLQLLSTPEGSWRTRHLRLRAHFLRERVKEGLWKLHHTPGVELSADMLTKSITLKSSWATFQNRVNLVDIGIPEAVERKRTIAKVAIAAIGLAVLSRVKTTSDANETARIAWHGCVCCLYGS